MTATRELELSKLSRFTTTSDLSLDGLASLPAYFGTAPNPDCIYDGSLIEFSHRPPLLADGGELVLGILGPFWDRIFRIEFFGVSAVELQGFGPSLSMNIRELVLIDYGHCKRCEVRGIYFPVVLAVNYAYATVSRQSLELPIQRSEPGT